ncbi:hypothetical protein JANAI62_32970 [Jannaschia pagri]|uniref:Uncharacterized protein n=1 Tax=Jannaschia pagri TaxID=2829797 RepID=A0ABQ4NQZ8_9RHOB|nr:MULTISPECIES: hypothetical protein [unclassified Jannaschia]GIT92839.1 hypothetical protein JANAI61_32970 [Jannaschia sp. AI_61]GIT96674.1 hypothetical protein JANAI62_32970 [Jannaschia sp. AI_62]
MAWHRTPATLRLDIRVTPPSQWLDLTSLRGAAHLRKGCALVLPRAVKQALAFLDPIQSVADPTDRFLWAERHSAAKRSCVEPQHDLAKAVVTARLGNASQGAAQLAAWVAQHQTLDPAAIRKLETHLRTAAYPHHGS